MPNLIYLLKNYPKKTHNTNSKKIRALFLVWLCFLNGCAVGPNYKPPTVEIPEEFKETPKGWKLAEPQDDRPCGEWWRMFRDPQLNALEDELNCSNKNIAAAAAQYRQSLALVDQAFAGYMPVVNVIASRTRSKSAVSGLSNNTGNTDSAITGQGTGNTFSSGRTLNNFFLQLSATWEPDLWGGVYRAVEASWAGAQASAANLAAVQLSMQASLAQYYFQLRTLDANQAMLDKTVQEYRQALQYAKNRYAAGVVSRLDVIQAETQLETAQVLAIDNGINRGVYEHAIAVLIGHPPSCFSLAPKIINLIPPKAPVQVPSTLLERRPDVGQAERLAAQANAQIGVAIAAYFPVIGLTATAGNSSSRLPALFLTPAQFWSIAAQMTQLIFDGGLAKGKEAAARATFEQSVAQYRQTVLTAFQDVEDSLVSIRLLKQEESIQKLAVVNAERALNFTWNQYKSGVVDYYQIILAQNILFNARSALIKIEGLEMNSTVNFVKALGGGWDLNPCAPCQPDAYSHCESVCAK